MTTINQILKGGHAPRTGTYPRNNKTSFLLFVLFLFFIATLPSLHTLSFIASWYDEKRLAQIIILISLVGVLITSPHFQQYASGIFSHLPGRKKLLLTIFFAFGVVSASVSAFPNWAFLELGNYFLLALLTLFIAYSIHNHISAEKLIIITFCITATLYMVAFLASLFAGLTNGIIDYHSLLSGFINRRFLNQFQSISFPILLVAPFLLSSGKKAYFLLSVLAAFWFMLMLVSDGRGVMLASFLGVLLSFILIPSSRMKWLLHTLFVVALGMLLFLGFDYLLSTNEVVNGNILRGTSGGRLAIWLSIIETIKDNPILGIGPMNYAVLPNSFSFAHPHNITLQLLTEFGAPATASLILFVASAFILWIKQQKKPVEDKKRSLISTALTASFIAAIVHGHLSGVFVMPLSQLSFVLICGWMISIYLTNTSDAKAQLTSPTLSSSVVIILVSTLSLSVLLTGSYPHIKSLITGATLEAAISPRYWSKSYRE